MEIPLQSPYELLHSNGYENPFRQKKKDVTEQNYIKCKCFEKVLALQEHYYIKGIERHLSHFLRKLHLAPFQFRMAFLLS